jgi:hypothetical protein
MANKLAVADQTRTNIYFMGAAGGPIKIGHAKDPVSRLAEVQTGHPARLVLIATVQGPASLERQYHAKFAHRRLHGEWFERCAEIEHEILRLDPDAMPRIDEWADLAGTVYGCALCGPYPCRANVPPRIERLQAHV